MTKIRKDEHAKEQTNVLSKSISVGFADTGLVVAQKAQQDILNAPFLNLKGPALTVTSPSTGKASVFTNPVLAPFQLMQQKNMNIPNLAIKQPDPLIETNKVQASKPFIMPFIGTPKRSNDLFSKALSLPLSDVSPSIFNRRSAFIPPELQEYIDAHKAEYAPTSHYTRQLCRTGIDG